MVVLSLIMLLLVVLSVGNVVVGCGVLHFVAVGGGGYVIVNVVTGCRVIIQVVVVLVLS